MDLDRYVTLHRGEWDRLRTLTRSVGQSPQSVPRDEQNEFVALHHRVSAQLSFVRGFYADPGLIAELNGLVAGSNSVLYRRTSSRRSAVRRFFSISFPGAVWHIRRAVGVSALALFIPWLVVAIWLGSSDEALSLAIDEPTRNALVERDFEDYYSSAAAEEFAVRVLVNNIQVSFLAYALGITFGVGTLYILAFNGFNIGASHGVFIAAGAQGTFFGLITPHGLLELSAVVIAGGAGLSMGWALVRPGDRLRSKAFGEEGKRSVSVILGLVLAFIVAGLIEGFVTPGLPLWPRIAVGTSVWAAFVVYIVTFGRRAELAGFTGLIAETEERAAAAVS